jgi:methionyl-tRNA formyltransferase
VATGSGALELLELQPAGKRPMEGAAWLAGVKDHGGLFGQ